MCAASPCCATTSGRTSAAPSPRSADPQFIDHMRRLGVTAVELMPVHAFVQDRHSAAEGPAQLLGLQHHRLLRARAALSVRQHRRRDAHRHPPAARRRHRGDPRRRLQSHRRGQRDGPDLVVPRPRQCELLPAGGRQSAPLRQRHRHRQHAESLHAARAADGDGFAALLGRPPSTSTASASISASRWDARSHGFDPGSGFFDAIRQDPVLSRVKLIAEPWDIGPGRLSARAASAGLRRMERPFPRRRAPLLARRCRPARRLRRPPGGLERPVRQAGAAAVGLDQLSSPRTTASPWPTSVSYAAAPQRGQRRGQQGRPSPRTTRPTGASRGRPTIPAILDTRGARAARAARHAVPVAGHADAAGGRRVRPHAARQQQRLLPGQRDLLARLEAWPEPSRAAR